MFNLLSKSIIALDNVATKTAEATASLRKKGEDKEAEKKLETYTKLAAIRLINKTYEDKVVQHALTIQVANRDKEYAELILKALSPSEFLKVEDDEDFADIIWKDIK